MKKVEENKLGTRSVGKLLFSLAIPTIVAQIVNMLYSIVDRIYIGHIPSIGAKALTGVGLTFPIIMLISAFSSLIGAGGAPLVAIKMGQKNNDEAEKILGNCFIILIQISIVLTIVFCVFGKKLMLLFGASSATLPYALSFLNTYILGTIFVQITLGMNTFITTQGFTKISMFTIIIGAVISIILDPIFIFGFKMGVQGAALANIIAQSVSAVWTLSFLFGSKTKIKIRKKNMHIKKSIIIPVLFLGVSPFVMTSTESLLNIALNSSLHRYGGDMFVGAMTIMTTLMQMMTLPITGLTQGAQPIISYNYGAKNNERVKKAFKLLIASSVGYTTLFWILMMTMPKIFISIFTSNAELIKTTVWSIRIYMAAIFVIGVQMSCQQTFVALGQAKVSLFNALLRKVILLIPAIYILPNFFSNKVFAVFLAEPVSDTIAVFVTVTMFLTKIKGILSQNTVKNIDNSKIEM